MWLFYPWFASVLIFGRTNTGNRVKRSLNEGRRRFARKIKKTPPSPSVLPGSPVVGQHIVHHHADAGWQAVTRARTIFRSQLLIIGARYFMLLNSNDLNSL